MEEESKKTRPGKGKNKAGESDETVAPVELGLDLDQVELQRYQDPPLCSLVSEGPGVCCGDTRHETVQIIVTDFIFRF